MGVQLDLDFREWRPIKGYEGLYDLRNDGLIYTYPRPHSKCGYTYGNKNPLGYMTKTLSKGKFKKLVLLHRLVWEVFVGPIPEGYDVHHINHNPSDNRLENLELIERKEHSIKHKTDRSEAAKKALSKPVLQYTLDGEFVAEYPSIAEASRETGISHISKCCNCKRKTAGSSIWRYK